MPSKSIPAVANRQQALEFRRRLARWFRRHGRDLPWRRSRDPWHVTVSEFMLQQTQVSRVEGYYTRFLGEYPTVGDLAQAGAARVRESWQGLGYYRRAANLHRLAVTVMEEHGGRFPRQVEELRRLPGVGRYTAGAVATFAFEQAEPAVDTNVARVIRRAFFARGRRVTEREIWTVAGSLVPRAGRAAWTFNQAIMELGALVCTARVARCEGCPVRTACREGRRATGISRSGPSPRRAGREGRAVR